MMKIDFHTHCFPDKIASRTIEALARASGVSPSAAGTYDSLVSSMRRSGVDLSVVLPVATKPSQVEKINDSAALINERYGEKGLFSCGAMHPEYPGWYDEMQRIKDLGLKGIKIHPVYQGVDIDDIRYIDIMKRAAELNLFVITHAGDDIGFPGIVHCSPEMCANAAEAVPGLTFILAHMGGWECWDNVCKVLKDTHVYLDTAFSLLPVHPLEPTSEDTSPDLLSREKLMEMIRLFGVERILFATDSPWADQKEYADYLEGLPLSEEEKEMIFSGNARRILKI